MTQQSTIPHMSGHHMTESREGFSLVELSIVLVILGLLTGGILACQNLIRAAELRAITSEFSNLQTATHFKRGATARVVAAGA